MKSYFQSSNVGRISITLGTSLLLQILNIGTGILTARFLGPSGKGQLTAIMLWPSILVALGSLGLGGAVTYYVSQKSQDSGNVFTTSILLGMFQSVTLIGLGLLIIPWVLASQGSDIVQMSTAYLVYIPLSLLTLYSQSLLSARMNFVA